MNILNVLWNPDPRKRLVDWTWAAITILSVVLASNAFPATAISDLRKPEAPKNLRVVQTWQCVVPTLGNIVAAYDAEALGVRYRLDVYDRNGDGDGDFAMAFPWVGDQWRAIPTMYFVRNGKITEEYYDAEGNGDCKGIKRREPKGLNREKESSPSLGPTSPSDLGQ